MRAKFRFRFARNTMRATRQMRALSNRPLAIEESLDIAFGLAVEEVTIAPAQVRSEIESLLKMLEAKPPRRVLEIGTAKGGTLFLLSRVARADAGLASIDLPGGEFGGGYGRAWVPLLKALPQKGQTLKLMRANSHEPRTLYEVRQWLGGHPLDVLFIDGDHRFDGVRHDFLTYGPLVRAGGLIAIHDIVPGSAHMVGGVPRFWQRVQSSYTTREFVHDWQQGGFGIGVVEVPDTGITDSELTIDLRGPDGLGEPEPFA
jgi:predicted O-methyltransferase YrrM